jgi:hypothetical protein
MNGLQAARLALADFWEESALLIGLGLLGGLLSLLLLPLPFVLAAHYGTADRIASQLVVSGRTWLRCGREHARFFYGWALLVLVVSIVLLGNFLFYQRFDSWWATPMRWLMGSLLALWLLPQPLVPALYIQQVDRRLRTALRNAVVVCLQDPVAVIILWLALLLVTLPLAYVAIPLVLLLQPLVAAISTRLIYLELKRPAI